VVAVRGHGRWLDTLTFTLAATC